MVGFDEGDVLGELVGGVVGKLLGKVLGNVVGLFEGEVEGLELGDLPQVKYFWSNFARKQCETLLAFLDGSMNLIMKKF